MEIIAIMYTADFDIGGSEGMLLLAALTVLAMVESCSTCPAM